MRRNKSLVKTISSVLFSIPFLPANAFASETYLRPVEDVLFKISDSLTGPVALAVALIGLSISAMILILGDPGKGGRMIACVVLGFSIVTAGINFLGIFATSGATM